MFIGGGPDGAAPPPREWPQLKGVDVAEARDALLKEDPSLRVVVVPPGQIAMTMDYCLTRVRVFTDADGKVARTPRTG